MFQRADDFHTVSGYYRLLQMFLRADQFSPRTLGVSDLTRANQHLCPELYRGL